MKIAKHKFGVLPYLGTGVLWIVDTFGTSSAWWAANVQPYAELFWPYAIGFVAGMLLQDVTNPQSWLRESWKLQIKKFEVEGLGVGHSVDGPKRLEVNVHIKFLRRLKSADLALRVHSCTGMQYAPHIYPIKGRTLVECDEGRAAHHKTLYSCNFPPRMDALPQHMGKCATEHNDERACFDSWIKERRLCGACWPVDAQTDPEVLCGQSRLWLG